MSEEIDLKELKEALEILDEKKRKQNAIAAGLTESSSSGSGESSTGEIDAEAMAAAAAAEIAGMEAAVNATKEAAPKENGKKSWTDEVDFPRQLPTNLKTISVKGFIIKDRYVIQNFKNQGSFGCVFEALDKNMNDRVVAIKINKDGPGADGCLMKEIDFLCNMQKTQGPNSNNNIIEFIDGFTFAGRRMMICEYLGYSLKQVIYKCGEKFNGTRMGLNLIQLKAISWQILNGLFYLHKNGLVHTDLKPENVMFKNNVMIELRLIDFGSYQKIRHGPVSPKAQTRFYRSPEVLLGTKKYSDKMDIWSLGCTMAEAYIGSILFTGRCTNPPVICYGLMNEKWNFLKGMVDVLGKIPQKMFGKGAATSSILAGDNLDMILISNYADGPIVNAPPKLVELLSKERIRRGNVAPKDDEEIRAYLDEKRLIEMTYSALIFDPYERANGYDMFSSDLYRP